MSVITVQTVSLATLPADHASHWENWYSANAARNHPLGHPKFLTAIANFFPNCRALVVRSGEDIVGYIPIQLENDVALPIPMCDYQAVANLGGEPLDFRGIFRAAGIRSWRYTSASTSLGLEKCSTFITNGRSPYVDLAGGFKQYMTAIQESGNSMTTLDRSMRRLKKVFGEIELHYGCGDDRTLARLLQLKQQQLRRTKPYSPHVHGLLEHLRRTPEGGNRGMCSILRVGSEDVAYVYTLDMGDAEFGWFYSYEENFRKYSPGSLVILKLIERLCELGRATLDLGPGGEAWKDHFANASIAVCSGRVDASIFRAFAVKAARAVQGQVRALRKKI